MRWTWEDKIICGVIAGLLLFMALMFGLVVVSAQHYQAYLDAHKGHHGHTVKHETPDQWIPSIDPMTGVTTIQYIPGSTTETWVCDQCK